MTCNIVAIYSSVQNDSGHLVPSLWDLHMFYLLRPILFYRSCRIFPDYALRISLGTFSTLLIAIEVRLLQKLSTTKQVCSKSTSKVFLRIPYLVPALALSFFMLHVAIYWQVISISYEMTNYEIFYARDRSIENLSHFHGTRTSTLSWTHAKRTPDGGPRKRTSNSTLFLSGLSRSVMCLNA